MAQFVFSTTPQHTSSTSSPSFQLRCYEDSWRPVRPAPFPARPQTAWRWPRRSPSCRCSLPTASRDRLAVTWQTSVELAKKLLADFGHLVWFANLAGHSCCRRSRSCRSLPGCSSWLTYTWRRPSWWREQTLPPDWLQTEKDLVTGLHTMDKTQSKFNVCTKKIKRLTGFN